MALKINWGGEWGAKCIRGASSHVMVFKRERAAFFKLMGQVRGGKFHFGGQLAPSMPAPSGATPALSRKRFS